MLFVAFLMRFFQRLASSGNVHPAQAVGSRPRTST